MGDFQRLGLPPSIHATTSTSSSRSQASASQQTESQGQSAAPLLGLRHQGAQAHGGSFASSPSAASVSSNNSSLSLAQHPNTPEPLILCNGNDCDNSDSSISCPAPPSPLLSFVCPTE